MSQQDLPDEDIVLADLADEELVEQMHDDLYDGLAEEIVEGTEILLSRGWDRSTRILAKRSALTHIAAMSL